MRKCCDRKSRCVICARPHKIEDNSYKVKSCHKKKGKVYIHVKLKCANNGERHFANSNR